MCTASTAKRMRRKAKLDRRYGRSTSKSNRRAFLAAKAAKAGRSFGFQKK